MGAVDLLSMMESVERNRLANDALALMVDRYARRAAQDGAPGLACLELLVDGDSPNVSGADVETLHLWSLALRMSPADLVKHIRDRVVAMAAAGEP
jgi:hypothetical protein